MKRILSLMVFMLFFVSANMHATVNVVRLTPEELSLRTEKKNLPNEFQSFDLDHFLKMTPADYQKLTGKKLGIKNTVLLKVAQWKIKNALDDNPATSGKSQLIALLLCIFIGALGIHRFYLGYTWQGVVQLLTLGLCGIWTLIDLIRIITGDLKPKNGDYSEKL